jgi:hypothetical protein
LRKHVDFASSGIEGSLQRDVETLLLGTGTVIGKIDSSTMALILNGRFSPEPSREYSSMFFTMASARLPCCTTLSRLPCSVSASSLISARSLLSPAKRLPQFVNEFDRDG